MASVVKRLRPRIVVPICMGSNPIRRPIIKKARSKASFFVSDEGENPSVVRARGGRGRRLADQMAKAIAGSNRRPV